MNADDTKVNSRRGFLKTSGIIAIAGISALTVPGLAGCSGDNDDVTPPEDLMREHGVLNRVLLVYDHFLGMIAGGQQIDPQLLSAAANIIKTFIEEYHEKQEEDFLFPKFEKANKLTDLVATLRIQHKQGRIVTQGIITIGAQANINNDTDKQKLSALLTSFIRMYRPHEAREDTVLFPAIRDIVSKHEFESMGDDFEKREHQLFGKGGFEVFVDRVGEIEKKLGIYDLGQFTPAV